MIRKWFYNATLSLLVGGCFVSAQSAVSDPEQAPNTEEGNKKQPAYPVTGPRFVICSPDGGTVKSPLFVKIKKEYLPVEVSPRFPGKRVTPNAEGKVIFYEEKPAPKEDKEGKQDMPKPYMTVSVPDEFAHVRSLCIVVPGEKPAMNQYFFLREDDFPLGGFHLVNFSPTPLTIHCTTTDQMPETGTPVAPYHRKAVNTLAPGDPNVWSVLPKAWKDGQAVITYAIFAPPIVPDGVPLPLRSSRMLLTPGQSKISIVVKDKKLTYAYRIISLQFGPQQDNKETSRPQRPTRPGRGRTR